MAAAALAAVSVAAAMNVSSPRLGCQKLKKSFRLQDHLSGSACVTSAAQTAFRHRVSKHVGASSRQGQLQVSQDRQDHPLALPRKAGTRALFSLVVTVHLISFIK